MHRAGRDGIIKSNSTEPKACAEHSRRCIEQPVTVPPAVPYLWTICDGASRCHTHVNAL